MKRLEEKVVHFDELIENEKARAQKIEETLTEERGSRKLIIDKLQKAQGRVI